MIRGRSMKTCRWLSLGLTVFVLCAGAAHGLIATALKLEKILGDSKYVGMAKISSYEPDKKRMILTLTEDIHGKPAFRQIAVLMEGDKDAAKYKQMPLLMKRLAADLPVVLFIAHKENNSFITYLYTNGTWIELKGKGTGQEPGVWDLTHGEPVLRKTFKGTTDELRQLIKDNIAGKEKLPDIDKKEPAG